MSPRTLILVDAQVSPGVCAWLQAEFELDARSFRSELLSASSDEEAFRRAREQNAIVLTKDADFVRLLRTWGPPQLIWLTCGDCSNLRLRSLLSGALPRALNLLRSGEAMVEIGDFRLGPSR